MTTRYRTIVADPPWDYPGGVSAGGTPGKPVGTYELPYDAMTTEALAAVPVRELAAKDAWLFLWATNRYLSDAFTLVDEWGFRYRQTLVWHKLGASPFGGTFASNAAEFLIAAARGNPVVITRWANHGSVITHNRMGEHSRKPEVFLDEIEASCPGPRVELFARRQRLGWDTWGHEALNHVSLASANVERPLLDFANKPETLAGGCVRGTT